MITTNSNIYARPDTQLSAQNPLIDMTFITMCTGMTDIWLYKLIGVGLFPPTHQAGPQLPLMPKIGGNPDKAAYCIFPCCLCRRGLLIEKQRRTKPQTSWSA